MSEVITRLVQKIERPRNFFEKNNLYNYTAGICYHGYLAMILPRSCHDLDKRSMYHDLP